MVLLGPEAGLAAPNGWISMDQGWIKLGHIREDVLGPFPGSGMAIRGRHRAPKWPKIAIMVLLGPEAGLAALKGWISVDQGWIKLGHIRGDALGPFPGFGMAIRGPP